MHGKIILLLTDMGSRDHCSLLACPPHQQASCSPARLGNSWCSPSPRWLQLPLLPFLSVFSDPSCGAQGRASDGVAQGSWREPSYMDVERLRVRRKAKLSTNHTDTENEGKFASLFSPSCFHLKKEAAQKSSPQPAKPDGPYMLSLPSARV